MGRQVVSISSVSIILTVPSELWASTRIGMRLVIVILRVWKGVCIVLPVASPSVVLLSSSGGCFTLVSKMDVKHSYSRYFQLSPPIVSHSKLKIEDRVEAKNH